MAVTQDKVSKIRQMQRRNKFANLTEREIGLVEDWFYAYCLWCQEKGLKIRGVDLAEALGFNDGI